MGLKPAHHPLRNLIPFTFNIEMSNISREASKPSEHLHKDAVSNPLSKKLNKILETRLDNDKVGICLDFTKTMKT